MMLLATIAGLAWAMWTGRRVLLTPWATYVRHSVVRATQKQTDPAQSSYLGSKVLPKVEVQIAAYLMTVRRVRWYPPHLTFEESWASHDGKTWAREGDGEPATKRQNERLSNAISIAVLRELETDAVLKETDSAPL